MKKFISTIGRFAENCKDYSSFTGIRYRLEYL